MLASILIPTRGRAELLDISINSILSRADNPDNVEFLLHMDEDENMDCYRNIFKKYKVKHFIGPRHFYVGLYKYYNELAKAATGKWLFIWNDDAEMRTNHWDTVLNNLVIPNRLNGMTVASTESNHGRSPITFPIFTKALFDVIGRVSLNCHVDTWLEDISHRCSIQIPIDIKIIRSFPEPQGPNTVGSHDYYSSENSTLRELDIQNILSQLRN